MNNVHFLLYCPFPLCQEDFIKGLYFCGSPFEPCSRMETMDQPKVYKPNTGSLHWLHVMISKRPGTVGSPGGIHRRRHQKRRKAVKLLPKCYPKQKSPAFRGGIFRKAELLFALFRYIVEGLKKSEGIFFITRARFRKAGFWLYQVHFSGFSAHKFRCFHCVFLSAQWIDVKLMSQGFGCLSSGSFRC